MLPGAPSLESFFDRDVATVARDLLGWEFSISGVGGTIVETEAYSADDPASHSYSGQTPRNRSMFGPPAHVYVYRSYGLHLCLNFVCEPGSAVLLRALAPKTALDDMKRRRGTDDLRLLCSGPGRLCQALSVTPDMDGLPLSDPRFHLAPPGDSPDHIKGRRIGITKGADLLRRFGLKGSLFHSRKFRADE